VAVGHQGVGQVGPAVLGDRDLQVQHRQRRVAAVREGPVRVGGLQPAFPTAVGAAGHRDLVGVEVGEGRRGQRGQVLAVTDLDVLVLHPDRSAGGAVRPGRRWVAGRDGRRVTVRVGAGRGVGLIGPGRALVGEAAGGVGQDVVAVLGEPVTVPVVLVGAVTLVGGGLPLVLVVAEPVEHHHQRVALRAVVVRWQGDVDVQRGAVEAGDLT